jgi:hypothetical protein
MSDLPVWVFDVLCILSAGAVMGLFSLFDIKILSPRRIKKNRKDHL